MKFCQLDLQCGYFSHVETIFHPRSIGVGRIKNVKSLGCLEGRADRLGRIVFKIARNCAIKWFSINHGQFPSAVWVEYRGASCARLSPPQIGAVLANARHIKGCRQVDFRNPIAE